MFSSNAFGGGLLFKAHVANYPVCWGANRPFIPGSEFTNPRAPVLLQIGTEDDYDNGADPCRVLQAVNPNLVQLAVYEGGFDAWDRVMIPRTVRDPFADRGSWLATMTGPPQTVKIKPDVEQAYASRKRVVRFFRHKL